MNIFNLFILVILALFTACSKRGSGTEAKTSNNNFTISVKSMLELDPTIQYQTVHEITYLHYTPFPIGSSEKVYPADVIIPGTFILTIPNGQVCSNKGYVYYKNKLVEELIWPWSKYKVNPEAWKVNEFHTPTYTKGKVLVLAQEGYSNYYHWLTTYQLKIPLLAEIGYIF